MKTLLLLTSLVFAITVNAKHRLLSLENAAKLNLLKFKIKGTGTHQGKCLNMQLESSCPDSLWLTLEAGCRLDSKNESEQDILVTQEQIFVLGGFQKANAKVIGYCCQASNHTPQRNTDFTIDKPTDKNLVSLARYLNYHRTDEQTTQTAVWCVSNGRPLASIPKINAALRAFVAGIRNEELPWYEVEYNQSVNNVMASQQAKKVFGYIDYKIQQSGKMKIELRDSKGRLMINISDQKDVAQGEHEFWFEMCVSHYPKGKYYLHFLSDNGPVTKKEFQI
ncbi:MAG: hypothetical protein V4677_00265 [Bacteroidota bacterium]